MHFRNILRFAQHVGDVLPAEETRPAVSVADGLGQQFWDLNGIYFQCGCLWTKHDFYFIWLFIPIFFLKKLNLIKILIAVHFQ